MSKNHDVTNILTVLMLALVSGWCIHANAVGVNEAFQSAKSIANLSARGPVSAEDIADTRNKVDTIGLWNSTGPVRRQSVRARGQLLIAEQNNQLRGFVIDIVHFNQVPLSAGRYAVAIRQWHYLAVAQQSRLQMAMSLNQLHLQQTALNKLRRLFSDQDYLQRARRVTLADWQAAKHSIKNIHSAKFLHFYNQRLPSARAWINTETSPSRS
jgi:hypothetical protein